MPAAIGIVYIAWDWAGPGADWRGRCRMLVRAGLITARGPRRAARSSRGSASGWIANLGTPGTVRSWMAPATAVGLLISGTAHVLGAGVEPGRGAHADPGHRPRRRGGHRVYCLRHRERMGVLKALGITMLAFVLLGPVVQPWYLTWGVIILAPVATGRMLWAILGISTVAPFIGLTGGAELLNQLVHARPGQHGPGRHGAVGVAIAPLGELDDVVAPRPLPSAGPAAQPPAPSAALES